MSVHCCDEVFLNGSLQKMQMSFQNLVSPKKIIRESEQIE